MGFLALVLWLCQIQKDFIVVFDFHNVLDAQPFKFAIRGLNDGQTYQSGSCGYDFFKSIRKILLSFGLTDRLYIVSKVKNPEAQKMVIREITKNLPDFSLNRVFICEDYTSPMCLLTEERFEKRNPDEHWILRGESGKGCIIQFILSCLKLEGVVAFFFDDKEENLDDASSNNVICFHVAVSLEQRDKERRDRLAKRQQDKKAPKDTSKKDNMEMFLKSSVPKKLRQPFLDVWNRNPKNLSCEDILKSLL